MSDSIVSCIKYNRPDGNINHYAILFAFDGVDVPTNECTIVILDVEVEDPTNLDQVKTLACYKAGVVKALYATGEEVDELVGPVEL